MNYETVKVVWFFSADNTKLLINPDHCGQRNIIPQHAFWKFEKKYETWNMKIDMNMNIDMNIGMNMKGFPQKSLQERE